MFFKSEPKPGSILVFDVIETLLDVRTLRPHFERIFNDGDVLKEWFAQMVLYSQTITLAGEYADFGKLARAALQMVGEIHQVQPTEEDLAGLTRDIRSLPPHADVRSGLQMLQEQHFYMVALTNSAEHVAKQQVENAQLGDMFEHVFSVNAVSKYKPAAETYKHVAEKLGVKTGALTMIAAHPWDLIGAKAAGCDVAFLRRPGTAWFPLTLRPALNAQTLPELANKLIERQRG